jgi:hypothetical protein
MRTRNPNDPGGVAAIKPIVYSSLKEGNQQLSLSAFLCVLCGQKEVLGEHSDLTWLKDFDLVLILCILSIHVI